MSDFIQNFILGNGQLYCDQDAPDIMTGAKALDVYYLECFKKEGSIVNMANLFCNSEVENIETCSISQKLTGEWFNRCAIGRYVSIADGVNIMGHGGVAIGDNVQIGKNVQIITVGHGEHPEQRHCNVAAPIVIEDNVVIEDGAILVNASKDGSPIIVGAGARVKSGALVTRNVMSGEVIEKRSYDAVDEFNFSAYESAIFKTPLFEDYHELRNNFNSKTIMLFPPLAVDGFDNINIGEGGLYNVHTRLSVCGLMHHGDGVLVAPFTEIHVPENSSLTLEDGVWLGANSRIFVPENTELVIGAGSIIGSQALITRDVEPMSLIVGHNRKLREISPELAPGNPEWLESEIHNDKVERNGRNMQDMLKELRSGREIDDLYHDTRCHVLGLQSVEQALIQLPSNLPVAHNQNK